MALADSELTAGESIDGRAIPGQGNPGERILGLLGVRAFHGAGKALLAAIADRVLTHNRNDVRNPCKCWLIVLRAGDKGSQDQG